jgi:hypothetical protein
MCGITVAPFWFEILLYIILAATDFVKWRSQPRQTRNGVGLANGTTVLAYVQTDGIGVLLCAEFIQKAESRAIEQERLTV